jgi:dihydroorotase-like cyclic amidohydrolase
VARAGVCARINPPVRHEADRTALWEALADGTLAHVTTDHAAFAPEEKAAKEGDFLTAPPGHPGLETLVPTLLDAVATGRMPMERASALLSGNAAARFRLPSKGRLAAGADADMILVDMAAETHITEATLLTNARAISRLTRRAAVPGPILRTILRGATVWDGAAITAPPGPGDSSPRRTRDDRTAPLRPRPADDLRPRPPLRGARGGRRELRRVPREKRSPSWARAARGSR